MSEVNEKTPLLEVRNLRKLFAGKSSFFQKDKSWIKAVDDVSFTLNPKETLGVVGESGCGKSTMGRSVLRLIEPTSGEIFYKGKDFTKASGQELRKMRADMQIIFQDPYASLNPRMTIGEIIAEPLNIQKRYKTQEETRAQVSALDVSSQSQVLNLLRQLQESMGMAYIFISHNLSVIKHISDRVMVMYLGHVVELADKKELFANPSHPYTQALLSAIPVPERHSKRKKIILQGDLPSPANPPSGCIFHTRCFMAQEICSTQKPELRDIGGGHLCACHFCNGACAQNETTEEK